MGVLPNQALHELSIMKDVFHHWKVDSGRLTNRVLVGIRMANRTLSAMEKRQKRLATQTSMNRVLKSLQCVQLSSSAILDLSKSQLQSFRSFAAAVLEYLRKIVNSNLEIYELVLKIQASIAVVSRSITGSLGDSFRFEDVLGRRMTLPYEYFGHWDVFQSMLRCTFRNMPGETKVLAGQYTIMQSNSPGQVIQPSDWDRVIFRGSRVDDLLMSINLSKLRAQDGKCPRPGCLANVESSMRLVFWCGKLFIYSTCRYISCAPS